MARNYKYGKRSKLILSTVDARLQEVCYRAQEIANNADEDQAIPDWGYHSGYRTKEDQQSRFKSGSSRADGVKNKSSHQFGLAVDFHASSRNGAFNQENLTIIAAVHLQAAGELGYVSKWGGLFTTLNDSPHFELIIEGIN